MRRQQTVSQGMSQVLPGVLFGNLTNCTINFSPQNFVVNMGQTARQVEREFDQITADMNFDFN